MFSTLSVVKFVGRTLFSTTINYVNPAMKMLIGMAWSNLSAPAMCCCAVVALLIVMYLISLGKRAAKIVLFAVGVLYYLYQAWFVREYLPVVHWYFLIALCAWGFACGPLVEAATGSVWNAAMFVTRKVTSFVLTLLSSVPGIIRRGLAARREGSLNNGATAPSVSAPPVEAKKYKPKTKAKAKKTKAKANVSVTSQAVPEPAKDQEVILPSPP